MKRIALIIAAMFACVSLSMAANYYRQWMILPRSSSPTLTPVSNIVANWNMNDNAANQTVVDSVGTWTATAQRNTSTITTNGVSESTGGANGALYFNGSSDYCTLPSSVIVGSSARTVVAWVKPVNVNVEQYVYSSGSGSSGKSFSFGIGYGTWTILGYGSDLSSSIAPVYGVWSLAAASFTNGTMQITVITTNVMTTQSAGGKSLNTDTTAPVIGNLTWANTKFAGAIDRVSIYSRALTTNELWTLYSNGNGSEQL